MPEWSSGYPYSLQFKCAFGNMEFMTWATVRSAGLADAHVRIKIAAKNINDIIYANDNRKWRGNKKPLDEMKEECEKVGLKLNI